MKKWYIYFVVIMSVMFIGSCVVLAVNNTEKYKNIPITAISLDDKEIDKIYKKSGKYFEKVEVNSEGKALLERKISDEKDVEIASKHIADVLEKERATKTTVEFLLYTDVNSGIEQRPVLAVTFNNVMTSYSDGLTRSSKTNENKRPNKVETKILIDSLTGDVITLICVGHNK